ncbi:hypothetical protein [Tindallia californiensis]|uniref:Uncharacterized protein n=1 Tax=Tindallia californiensis TaxID=159292 RepID=A0A1H3KI49_9FIRM|nr:hypothetical protein [Tindallia californiensis]SDY51892.1 hypothetical protein SAMN05192546_102375 [Tindallia californiensis]
MDKNKSLYHETEYLNDFIDELIMECKPTEPPYLDQDMANMLETVRSVKRLKNDDEKWEWQEPQQKSETPTLFLSPQRKKWIKWISVAATIVLIVGALQMQRGPEEILELASTDMAMEESADMQKDAAPRAFSVTEEALEAAMMDPVSKKSTATVFNVIDRNYLELNLLEEPFGVHQFKVSEELREQLTAYPIQPGALISISFEAIETEQWKLTNLDQIDQVVVTGVFHGAVDSNSVEVSIDGHYRVLSVSQEAAEKIKQISGRMAEEAGIEKPVRITITSSDIMLNGEVKKIEVLE